MILALVSGPAGILEVSASRADLSFLSSRWSAGCSVVSAASDDEDEPSEVCEEESDEEFEELLDDWASEELFAEPFEDSDGADEFADDAADEDVEAAGGASLLLHAVRPTVVVSASAANAARFEVRMVNPLRFASDW